MTTTTVKKIDYGAQYLRIVAPANAALDGFTAGMNKYQAATVVPQADFQRLAAPLIAAYSASDNALLRASWPKDAVPDIKALVTADAEMIALLQSASSSAAWESAFAEAAGRLSAAVNIVRADLGLPPRAKP